MALTRPLSRDWGDRISKATGSRGPGVKGQEGIQRKGAGMFKVLRRERAWLGKVSRSGVGGPTRRALGTGRGFRCDLDSHVARIPLAARASGRISPSRELCWNTPSFLGVFHDLPNKYRCDF